MSDVRGALREAQLGERPRTVNRGRMPVVERELSRVVATGVPGAVVEFGCFRGGMTAWMRAVLEGQGCSDRVIHTYDAFQGLPEAGAHDGDHLAAGEFAACATEVRSLHETWGLPQPVIHEGWFNQTLPHHLPERIAFGYLDAGRYASHLSACLRTAPFSGVGARPRRLRGRLRTRGGRQVSGAAEVAGRDEGVRGVLRSAVAGGRGIRRRWLGPGRLPTSGPRRQLQMTPRPAQNFPPHETRPPQIDHRTDRSPNGSITEQNDRWTDRALKRSSTEQMGR